MVRNGGVGCCLSEVAAAASPATSPQKVEIACYISRNIHPVVLA